MLAEHGTYLVADVYDGDWINEAGARDGWPAETMAKNVADDRGAARRRSARPWRPGSGSPTAPTAASTRTAMVAIQLGYQVRLGQTPAAGAALGDARPPPS